MLLRWRLVDPKTGSEWWLVARGTNHAIRGLDLSGTLPPNPLTSKVGGGVRDWIHHQCQRFIQLCLSYGASEAPLNDGFQRASGLVSKSTEVDSIPRLDMDSACSSSITLSNAWFPFGCSWVVFFILKRPVNVCNVFSWVFELLKQIIRSEEEVRLGSCNLANWSEVWVVWICGWLLK